MSKLTKSKGSATPYLGWKEGISEEENKFLGAIYQGNTGTIEECIKNGVDPNLTDDDGLTPLQQAATRGDVTIIRILLTAPKIDIDRVDPQGMTALMFACIYGNLEAVRELLRKGANPNLANVRNRTALHLAATNNSVKISVLLVTNGANINVRDVFDNTPLSIAVIDLGSIPLATALLKRGANATVVKDFPLFLEAVLNCYTMDRLKLIKILLYHSADIRCIDKISKRNCLHYVGITGYLPAAQVLLKRADSNLYGTDLTGRTPLDIAWDHRNFEVYKHYIDWYEKNELKATLEDDILQYLYKLFGDD